MRYHQIAFHLQNNFTENPKFRNYLDFERILFGHEIVASGDDHRLDVVTSEPSESERIGRKVLVDRTIQELVVKNLKKAHEKSSKTYNLRFRKPAPCYSVGQKVYRRNFALSSAGDAFNAKLGSAYIPCTIVAKRGTNSYELADEAGKHLGVFSASDLKPGIPEN